MEQFDADRPAMLQRAKDAGVESILAIGSGTGPGSLDCAIRLAAENHGIYASIGIHPHEAKLATDADFAELDGLAKSEHVIAWGEIGLDYYYDHSPRDIQKNDFSKQMELAAANGLPIIIHCRPSETTADACDDTLHILREN